MKTITYNPETHVLVPREPSEEMFAAAQIRSMTRCTAAEVSTERTLIKFITQ